MKRADSGKVNIVTIISVTTIITKMRRHTGRYCDRAMSKVWGTRRGGCRSLATKGEIYLVLTFNTYSFLLLHYFYSGVFYPLGHSSRHFVSIDDTVSCIFFYDSDVKDVKTEGIEVKVKEEPLGM